MRVCACVRMCVCVCPCVCARAERGMSRASYRTVSVEVGESVYVLPAIMSGVSAMYGLIVTVILTSQSRYVCMRVCVFVFVYVYVRAGKGGRGGGGGGGG